VTRATGDAVLLKPPMQQLQIPMNQVAMTQFQLTGKVSAKELPVNKKEEADQESICCMSFSLISFLVDFSGDAMLKEIPHEIN
jgi:hypothetical protein